MDGSSCDARVVYQRSTPPSLPFFFILYAMRVLKAGAMVAHDGPISVARSFTAADWRRLIAQSEIPAERIRIK
jgi:hypothetical protein